MGYREMEVSVDYSGPGEQILRRFVLPLLKEARRYDRITSFFTVGSLVAIAEGLDALRLSGGRMRLILGIHDVPEELAQAALRSNDSADVLINGVRERLIAQVATIQSELEAQRLACIAWMLKDKLLQVKVAAPNLSLIAPPGLFHNKAFLFEDESGDIVVGVGSPNETGSGLGGNIEQLIAFTSWAHREHAASQVDYFTKLWNDGAQGVSVRTLDNRFCEQLLAALSESGKLRGPRATLSDLLSLAQRMEPFAFVSGKYTSLYPHQERAILDALSRWPVRVLLADEVGLGKTFETAAVVKHLLEHTAAASALLLVPKAVLRQWQEELYENFNIEAWVFESSSRTFVSPDGHKRQIAVGQPVLNGDNPQVVLMSAQYARGSRGGGSVVLGATALPDILVVDEAHAARVHVDTAGNARPTLMWDLVNELSKKIPHVILATATPMQVHWREYFGLLEVLGLPSTWRNPADYEVSLRVIADNGERTLPEAKVVGDLIRGVVNEMKPSQRRLSREECVFIDSLIAKEEPVDSAFHVYQHWDTAKRTLVKLHPAHLLTVRNTRSALQSVGYSFPERNLLAPPLSASADVAKFYVGVEKYLEDVYFSVEQACFPKRKFNVGFVKSSYQQRLASSLECCRLSLLSRHNKLNGLLDSVSSGFSRIEEEVNEMVESEEIEDTELFESGASGNVQPENSAVVRAARFEVWWLTDLIEKVSAILDRELDPKLGCTIQLLDSHVTAGDRVLVFSRYTDTIDAAISAWMEGSALQPKTYGVFTGKDCKIGNGRNLRDCTRVELKSSLESGDISVVFCSEAASEGLNLQAARVLINVDVPWNPARLEQRIGRIARLGQRSKTVDIYNLWYPKSIEAKMYKRLLERRDLYELAVGEFPEVVGAEIRETLSTQLGGGIDNASDAIVNLQKLRQSIQLKALKELWTQEVSGHTHTRKFREKLAEIVNKQAESLRLSVVSDGRRTRVKSFSFTLESGEEDTISLSHPVMSLLNQSSEVSNSSLQCLWSESEPHLFALCDSRGVRPLQPASLPAVMVAVLNTSNFSELLVDAGSVCNSWEDSQLMNWLPVADGLSVPTHPDCPIPKRNVVSFRELTVRNLIGTGGIE